MTRTGKGWNEKILQSINEYLLLLLTHYITLINIVISLLLEKNKVKVSI